MPDSPRYQCIPGTIHEMSIGDKLAPQVFHSKNVWDTLIVLLNVKETLCFCVIYMLLLCIYLKSMVISKCNIWAIYGSARHCGVMNISAWNIMQPLNSQRAIFGICKAIAHFKVVVTYHGTDQSITLTCRFFSSGLSEYMISNGSETWISKTGQTKD